MHGLKPLIAVTLSILIVSPQGLAGDEAEGGHAGSSQQRRPLFEGEVYSLDPIVVTATRTERNVFSIPRTVTIVQRPELRRKNKLSVLDALDGEIGVWVEKRTTTTSDPVMRGMSGYHILALIDGNTLSTLWGEGGVAGDDMYGKVDADNIERIEIVRGPSSVLYGSNALAGVMNFITRSSPLDYTEAGTRLGAATKLSYGSAARERRVRTDVYGAAARIRFLLGVSYREVGDARAGRGIRLQVPTSGRDLNWDLNLKVRPADTHEFTLTLQDVDRDDVHRFYRPTQTNYNDRLGVSAAYTGRGVALPQDKLTLSAYYQHKKDTRVHFESDETGWAITKTYTSDAQWSALIGASHEVTGGFHFELDDGESPDDEQFTRRTAEGVSKDAPDSEWRNLAAYAQDEWRIAEPVQLIMSARWDRFDFESKVDELYHPPGNVDPLVDEIKEQEDALTGGLSLLVSAADYVNLFTNIGRGFRQYAPVFGIKQHAYGIQVPSGLLNPAVSLNYEAGIKVRTETARAQVSAYYSDLSDFPVVVPSTFEGRDWYDWDDSGNRDPGEDVFVTENSAEAYVYGTELEGEYRPGRGWSLYGGLNWNYGQDETNDEPLRHTVPLWGMLRVSWLEPRGQRIWVEFSAEMAGRFTRIPSDRIGKDPGFRLDPQDGSSPLLRTDGEIPGWTVYNLRGEYVVSDHIRLNMAIENLTDHAYRRIHSRWDELGINFLVGVTLTT
jgi:hemoglobin/transferrin/lactoferrin receptor protein